MRKLPLVLVLVSASLAGCDSAMTDASLKIRGSRETGGLEGICGR